jgi:hypothetical protein
VGLVGLLLAALLVVAAGIAAARALRSRDTQSRGLVGASLGMVFAGVVLMLFQSYVYSVGNIATVSFWLGIFVLVAAASAVPGEARVAGVSRTRATALAAGVLVLAAVLVVAGRWERGRYIHKENAEMRSLFLAAGGKFDSRTLTAYRAGPPDCLWYVADGKVIGVSLCFDRSGRLVEAADRRFGAPVYWSLQPNPEAATIRVEPQKVATLLARLDRFVRLPRRSGG